MSKSISQTSAWVASVLLSSSIFGGLILYFKVGFEGHSLSAKDPHGASHDTPHNASVSHWTYAGSGGPEHWGGLSKDYAMCSSGKHQSPIDLLPGQSGGKSPDLKYNYHDAHLNLKNNGHTVQGAYDPGSFLVSNNHSFELKQFHFHSPSEHTINGAHFEMEMHLVHMDEHGKLAVLGVMIEEGKKNEKIEQLWEHLPSGQGDANSVQQFNVADLLPANPEFFAYSGSLTTPPCSEEVSWHVVKEPIQFSARQIEDFVRIFGKNNRPVQPVHDRLIAFDGHHSEKTGSAVDTAHHDDISSGTTSHGEVAHNDEPSVSSEHQTASHHNEKQDQPVSHHSEKDGHSVSHHEGEKPGVRTAH